MSRWLPRTTLALCAALAVGSCAHRSNPTSSEPLVDDLDNHPLDGYSAAFVLSWQGLRVGDATERVHQHGQSLHYTRHERITVRRADSVIQLETRINIEANTSLRASRVTVRRRTGATTVSGVAQRDRDNRWRVWFGNEPMRSIDASATPAELVPLALKDKQRRRFKGRVFLAGFGFAEAELRVSSDPRAGAMDRVRAVASTGMGQLESEIEFQRDGTVARVRGADASEATRVDPAAMHASFTPPEIVDSATMPVTGPMPLGNDRVTIELVGVKRPPPAMPGQRIWASARGYRLDLVAGDVTDPRAARHMNTLAPRIRHPRAARAASVIGTTDPQIAATAASIVQAAGAWDRRSELIALTRATEKILADDLGAPGVDATNALALGRGDCTAHASLLAALAQARGIRTRLVTGYRLDGKVLVRHRWIVAQLDTGWITVDPTFGEAPSRARLIGLATHTGSAADLAMVDELAFSGYHRAQFRFVR